MLGAIIGDIVGSRFEFNPTNDYNFELFGEGCNYTDDTICTIAVADALLSNREYGESIHEWCRKYPDPMGGYGLNFKKWVESDDPRPYGSFGNGSAMRVSPIGWWFQDVEQLLTEAKKSAECTHDHYEGIKGAQAVAWSILECISYLRGKDNSSLTPDQIRDFGISPGVLKYPEFNMERFNANIDRYRNQFDETCQGTVPVALAIVMHSNSFEDAIRKAVSLGADADTLGAIVGSIAEPIWGIPEWMKEKALSYLPDEMKAVYFEFQRRLGELHTLCADCEYYKIDECLEVDDARRKAYDIEREWAHALAKSYSNHRLMKQEMEQITDMDQWKTWAREYALPLSLLGYMFRHTGGDYKETPDRIEQFLNFLESNYFQRKGLAQKKQAAMAQLRQMETLMFLNLGLGNMMKFLKKENHMPSKETVATGETRQTHPMPEAPDAISTIPVKLQVNESQMDIIRKGHIPEEKEDHWFMYADDDTIRYSRSDDGMCVFEAHYVKNDKGYLIDRLTVNRKIAKLGVNGDIAAIALFRYLLVAETGGEPMFAWQKYIEAVRMGAMKK